MSSTAATATGIPLTSSPNAHQRSRPVDWVNVNTWVPRSSSRLNSPAPAMIPSTAGATTSAIRVRW